MSYCRWSSDDYQCDLYCYEDALRGWVTHVALNRVVGDVPKLDWSALRNCTPESAKKFSEQHARQHAFLMSCERRIIDLPHAGESFADSTLVSFRDRLLVLRMLGYRFPDEVLEEVEQELQEQTQG